MMNLKRHLPVALSLAVGFHGQVNAQASPAFTDAQAERGKATYTRSCLQCHGKDLEGGQFAPPLFAIAFLQRWAGRPVAELLSVMQATMPPGNAGSIDVSAYVDIIAYILKRYGVEAGSLPLPVHSASLSTMLMPGKGMLELMVAGPSGELAPGVALPQWPARADPLKDLTPVTDTMLKDPPSGAWLGWRRTQDAVGFSPLAQITRDNVQNLRVAWTLGLPAGSNQATPLVHDDVMFVHSFGDHIQALDATSGDELWRYSRKLPPGRAAMVHRNIALYDDRVYLSTSDAFMVALEAKTGQVVWEQSLGDFTTTEAKGGPLVAKGVVMQGLNAAHGGYIVGLDAATGKSLWRFHSIAQPGDPNYGSWNGLPLEQRSGGSVWTAGSYDAERHLAFFGPAPTYDTGPLRNLVKEPGITNDALYTNTTLALDPETGRLVWYYQHLSNDQWNLDWAFERQIVYLPVKGKKRKFVITAGKPAIYDVLDAETGAYAFSIDLGLQNFITAIDPKTGVKSIDPNSVPGDGERKTICPHQGGGKNWLPASFNPTTQILYVPLVESCMDLIPTSKLEGVNLSTNVRWTLRARPDSDGKYGRLQAINFETRKTVWMTRQRAPQTTGVLATAGNVVFAGALDRWFTAYDAATGTSLWKIRVNDTPNAAPITYLAKGKQYIALIVGVSGYGQAAIFPPLVPEILPPVAPNSAIWVFELPDRVVN